MLTHCCMCRQVIFTVAAVLGGVACLSSLLLLWACLDSHRRGSLFHRMHLPSIPYGKIITVIYLKVLSHLPWRLATAVWRHSFVSMSRCC